MQNVNRVSFMMRCGLTQSSPTAAPPRRPNSPLTCGAAVRCSALIANCKLIGNKGASHFSNAVVCLDAKYHSFGISLIDFHILYYRLAKEVIFFFNEIPPVGPKC